MKREIYTIIKKETSAKIHQTAVESVRIKEIQKRGVRVYDQGIIGISGAVGDVPLSVLEDQARENLSTGIEYPYPLESNHIEARDYTGEAFSAESMLETAKAILGRLETEYTDFSFSERFTVRETYHKLESSEGLDLSYRDSMFSISLVMKEKTSANLFDGFMFYEGRSFDIEKFWDFNHHYLEAYRNLVDLPVASGSGEKMPVFFLSHQAVEGVLNRTLNGERYANGSSLLKGRLGDQVFNPKVNISMYRGPVIPEIPFFDAEGMVLEGDQLSLVEKGVFVKPFADKQTHAKYGVALTGGASGAYDGKPRLEGIPLRFETDSESIKRDLKGQPAVLVVAASGGDFTASGDYASPVQLSFLFDGERIIGKLPEYGISSSLFKMLGEDYIGTYESPFYLGDGLQLQGYYMTIL